MSLCIYNPLRRRCLVLLTGSRRNRPDSGLGRTKPLMSISSESHTTVNQRCAQTDHDAWPPGTEQPAHPRAQQPACVMTAVIYNFSSSTLKLNTSANRVWHWYWKVKVFTWITPSWSFYTTKGCNRVFLKNTRSILRTFLLSGVLLRLREIVDETISCCCAKSQMGTRGRWEIRVGFGCACYRRGSDLRQPIRKSTDVAALTGEL